MQDRREPLTTGQASEVTEDAARGETREIYGDIRACFRGPIVNQIYRRIAATPGCLEWAWGSVRPMVVSGDLESESKDLVRAIEIPAAGEISPEDLLSAGIDQQALATICRVLDTYNRSNPMNVIAVKVLRLSLDAKRHAAPFTVEKDMDAGDAMAPLPPLIDIAGAEGRVRDAMNRFAREASGGSGAIVPTLFRHFGEWPGFLDLAAGTIGPLTRSSSFADLVGRLDREAAAAANRLLGRAETPDDGIVAPTGPSRDALSDLLDLFPTAICGMIVIGWRLRGALPLPR